ncbi:MAG: hypothetical protein DLM72_21530 [Candidatus Nitrosopolaris wilkensis]|nr:MAG: hypothetical protein DLM72_21530 [Candidatus Nitrosopolaris wilkensis]
MRNKNHNTQTEKNSGMSGNNDDRNKRKLNDDGNTALSKRMNSERADEQHAKEPMIIRPLPLKYTKVSILPSHLKLERTKKTTNRESKITK